MPPEPLELYRQYHPDKPTGDEDMYELVQHAYGILSDPLNRESYDNMYKISNSSQSDHYSLKNNASKYFDAIETDITNTDKKLSKTGFFCGGE